MPFTYADARELVGDSTDWTVGLCASLEKWEQIADGDEDTYSRGSLCGLCVVAENRGVSCNSCPALHVCDAEPGCCDGDAEAILQMLEEIALEKDN